MLLNDEIQPANAASKAVASTDHAPASLGETIELAKNHFLTETHLFEHVQDATYFELPKFLGGRWDIPQLVSSDGPLLSLPGGIPLIQGKITKFMILEVLAAVLIFLVFTWLARKISSGDKPTGKIWNFLEAFIVFIREDVAIPAIGKHDAGRFMSYLLSAFFFILALNLLGMLPFMGSATASIAVTTVFAVLTFAIVVGSGMKKMGVVGFLKAQAPHIDLPFAVKIVLIPMMWVIEMFGLLIKHFVLAVRLFANMFAGHLGLAVFLAFIGVAGTLPFWGSGPITLFAILASLAFSVLELLVAFLQAYVFAFLTALFIGSAQHAH